MDMSVAKRLYELRKQRGYSQEELADKLGLSRQAISKWERAEASPDTDNLIALSKLYDISLDELLGCEKRGAASEEETKKEHVHVSLKGIHVENEDESVHISWKDGIHVENKEDSVHMDKGSDHIFVNGQAHNIKDIKNKSRNRAIFSAIFALIVSIGFLCMGVFLKLWHPGWLLFFLIPIVESLVTAVHRKNGHFFAYPILTVVIFLILGFSYSIWAYAWIIFCTIPLYYAIFPRDNDKDEENEK